MTISEIQKILKTSFKNGLYIRRPHFDHLGIEVYLNRNGNTWQLMDDIVFKIDLMQHELESSDWEICL